MKKHIENIFSYLIAGGKAIVETTSPWSQYYSPFWEKFTTEYDDTSMVASFDLTEDEMVAAKRTKSDVCLTTPSMAAKMFKEAGFTDV